MENQSNEVKPNDKNNSEGKLQTSQECITQQIHMVKEVSQIKTRFTKVFYFHFESLHLSWFMD